MASLDSFPWQSFSAKLVQVVHTFSPPRLHCTTPKAVEAFEEAFIVDILLALKYEYDRAG